MATERADSSLIVAMIAAFHEVQVTPEVTPEARIVENFGELQRTEIRKYPI